MPSRRGLPPVVIWRGVNPSHAAKSRPRAKNSSIADCGHKSRRVDRSDPGDRYQASHRFVLPGHADELRIKGCNALVERTPFAPQIFDQQWMRGLTALLLSSSATIA